MPKLKKLLRLGAVDPITIIGILFLLIALGVGAYVVSNKGLSLNINERAGVDGGLDTLSGNSKGNNFGTTGNTNAVDPQADRNTKLAAKKKQDEKAADDPVQQQPVSVATTKPKFESGCSYGSGGTLAVGSKVVGGANVSGTSTQGTSGYAICDANLGWIDCPTCNNSNLTTTPTYIENDLKSKCNNDGNTWDDALNKCVTPASTNTQVSEPITIAQNSSSGYISLSDTVRDKEVQKNNIIYQQKQQSTKKNNKDYFSTANFSGATVSKNIGQIAPYLQITTGQVENVIRNIPGMEWYDYALNQSNASQNTLKSYAANINAVANQNTNDFDLLSYIKNKLNNSPELQGIGQNGISYTNTVINPINKTGQAKDTNKSSELSCGKPGLTKEERDICTNIAQVTAYNMPVVGDYIKSYSPDKVNYNYESLGYNSLNECLDDNYSQGRGMVNQSKCYGYTPTKEQVTSSIRLGTKTGEILALPVAPAVFGTESILAVTLGVIGSSSTVSQTSEAVIANIEGRDDALYQTSMAFLSWVNLGTADYLAKAWEVGSVAMQQSARALNTIVSTANLGFDSTYTYNTCSEYGLFTLECGGSLIPTTLDIAFGSLDYHQGQLNLNPITAFNETIDSVDNIATKAILSMENYVDNSYLRGINNEMGLLPDSNQIENILTEKPASIIIEKDIGSNTTRITTNGTDRQIKRLAEQMKKDDQLILFSLNRDRAPEDITFGESSINGPHTDLPPLPVGVKSPDEVAKIYQDQMKKTRIIVDDKTTIFPPISPPTVQTSAYVEKGNPILPVIERGVNTIDDLISTLQQPVNQFLLIPENGRVGRSSITLIGDETNNGLMSPPILDQFVSRNAFEIVKAEGQTLTIKVNGLNLKANSKSLNSGDVINISPKTTVWLSDNTSVKWNGDEVVPTFVVTIREKTNIFKNFFGYTTKNEIQSLDGSKTVFFHPGDKITLTEGRTLTLPPKEINNEKVYYIYKVKGKIFYIPFEDVNILPLNDGREYFIDFVTIDESKNIKRLQNVEVDGEIKDIKELGITNSFTVNKSAELKHTIEHTEPSIVSKLSDIIMDILQSGGLSQYIKDNVIYKSINSNLESGTDFGNDSLLGLGTSGGGSYTSYGGQKLIIDPNKDLSLQQYLLQTRNFLNDVRKNDSTSRVDILNEYVHNSFRYADPDIEYSGATQMRNNIYSQGTPVKLGQFIDGNTAVCREFAACLHVALADNGKPNYMTVGEVKSVEGLINQGGDDTLGLNTLTLEQGYGWLQTQQLGSYYPETKPTQSDT